MVAYCVNGPTAEGLIVITGQPTAMVYAVSLKQPLVSVARMLNVTLCTTVGVPLIRAVVGVTPLVRLKPVGRLPITVQV